MKMFNLTQEKFHVSFGALMAEARNGDLILINQHTFRYENGSLLSE
jgi:hypothetical protein